MERELPAKFKGIANNREVLVKGKNDKVRFLCDAYINNKWYAPSELVPEGIYPAGTTYTQKEEY